MGVEGIESFRLIGDWTQDTETPGLSESFFNKGVGELCKRAPNAEIIADMATAAVPPDHLPTSKRRGWGWRWKVSSNNCWAKMIRLHRSTMKRDGPRIQTVDF